MDDKQPRKVKFPAGDGLLCPACGCKHLLVETTYPWTAGQKVRRRKCRNCGRVIETVESISLT
jgi:transcriptional regulator NrdR family protein